MNRFSGFLFFCLLSTLLALSLTDKLGVCVHQGDPLQGVIKACP